MAFESSLRLRRSLVWETRDVSKYQKESPVFSLMHAKWTLQMNPVFATGKFFPISYNIKLRNYSGFESFEPFEVVTYLVDRRNNSQMHCSKMTVYSACETLFKASFDSTYEKLPGLKLYDDVVVLCTFYPSTGLAVDTEMERGSSLRIRHSLVWKTGKPATYQDRESPKFDLNNSKWKLELHLGHSSQNKSPVYQLCLRNASGIQSFQPFDIETFLLDRKNFVQICCSKLTVSSVCEVLYKAHINSIYKELPGLKESDEITIVCAFGPPTGSAFNEKMENDITFTIESSNLQNKSSYLQGNIAKCSPLNVVPNFEDLSKDLGSLLDNGLMTDVQLKCGEDVFSAHKAVLVARSAVFSTMLQKQMVENSDVKVEVKEVEPFVFREFLRYLYEGTISVDLSDDMLCNLYTASNNYAVLSLKKLCSYYMVKILNTENFVKILILADVHKDKELLDAVACFIRGKPDLLMSDSWIKFSEKCPKIANEIYRIHMMNALKICAFK